MQLQRTESNTAHMQHAPREFETSGLRGQTNNPHTCHMAGHIHAFKLLLGIPLIHTYYTRFGLLHTLWSRLA